MCHVLAGQEGRPGVSRDGERILYYKDLVVHDSLPSQRDAAPTRTHTASHLGNGTGVPARTRSYAERAASS